MQLPLRRLLGYLCLRDSPSRALLHALAFLAEDPIANAQSQDSGCAAGSVSLPTEETPRRSPRSAAGFGVSIQRIEELFPRGCVAPLAEVYAVCVGLGFRRPWKGASPVAQTSFAEFTKALASQNLLAAEERLAASASSETGASAAPLTPEDASLSSARPESPLSARLRESRPCVRLDRFVTSALFASMLAAARNVYARGVLVTSAAA